MNMSVFFKKISSDEAGKVGVNTNQGTLKAFRIHLIRTIFRGLHFIINAISPNIEVTAAPNNIHVDWDVPVTARDGTVLRVNVFRPVGPGPFPVLMSAHPYGKDKIPEKTRSGKGVPLQSRFLPQPHRVRISAYTSWEAPDPVVWVDEGYAVLNADLRGGGTSEGVGDLFSDQEAEDYYDLIEWAGVQSWSSGKVGLDGVSYLAISQYKVAALQPPHLAAICPWEGLTDLYRDFARPGGILEEGFSKLWSSLTGKEARIHTSLYDAIVQHTERDEWYTGRTPDLGKIQVPMLVCGSFSDQLLHIRGSFEAFRRAGSSQKWLCTHRDGKWCAYYSKDATRTRIRFFDHFLKGLENGWDQTAPVRLEITEEGSNPVSVTYEHAWPPKDVEWTKVWLDAETSTMGFQENHSHSSAKFEAPDGRVSFIWTVPEDMDVMGQSAVYLNVELQGEEDTLMFAGLRKFSKGVEIEFEGSYGFSGDMVSKGWQRAAHRDLDPTLSTPQLPVYTHDSAKSLRNGEVASFAIAMRPHATRFRRGDQLRLDLQGRWFYPKSIFGGQFPAAYQKSTAATVTLHTGENYPAYLLLATRKPGVAKEVRL